MRAIRKLIVVQRTNAHVTEALESKRREVGQGLGNRQKPLGQRPWWAKPRLQI